jgi:hypothetical protein
MIAGVDIGLSGGIGLLDDNQAPIGFPMPVVKTEIGNELDYKQIYAILSQNNIKHIFIEKQSVRPMDGKKGAFTHGGQYWFWRGVVSILDIPVTYVAKQTWGKKMMPDMDRKLKESSFSRLYQLYPELNGKFKKKDDGIVEAILIARYGRELQK